VGLWDFTVRLIPYITRYEMIVGLPPFYNKNLHHMYLLIKRTEVKWPSMERHGVEVSD